MYVWLVREGECDFVVSWVSPTAGAKCRTLDSRDAAERFAEAKAGKRGCVVSTLDMTADQLARHRERMERSRATVRALLANHRKGS